MSANLTLTATDDIDSDGPGSATTGSGGGGSFPVNSVIDAFNRADGGMGANWTNAWESGSSSFEIFSNQARPAVATNNNSTAYWNVQNFGADVEVYVTLGANVGGYCQLAARLVSEGTGGVDGYLLSTNGSNLEVYRIDNGGFTLLGSSITQSVTSGDAFGMSIVGDVITVYYKASGGSWVSKGTRTDSTHGATGKVGLRGGGASDRFDDFGAGSL